MFPSMANCYLNRIAYIGFDPSVGEYFKALGSDIFIMFIAKSCGIENREQFNSAGNIALSL